MTICNVIRHLSRLGCFPRSLCQSTLKSSVSSVPGRPERGQWLHRSPVGSSLQQTPSGWGGSHLHWISYGTGSMKQPRSEESINRDMFKSASTLILSKINKALIHMSIMCISPLFIPVDIFKNHFCFGKLFSFHSFLTLTLSYTDYCKWNKMCSKQEQCFPYIISLFTVVFNSFHWLHTGVHWLLFNWSLSVPCRFQLIIYE